MWSEFLSISTCWTVTDLEGKHHVVVYIVYVLYYHLIKNEPHCLLCLENT
jgi:hypothetical protein